MHESPPDGIYGEDTVWNPGPAVLYEEAIRNGEGELTADFVLNVDTGKYTGRSPHDKFYVDEPPASDDIDWNTFNLPASPELFDHMHRRVTNYLEKQKLYVKDLYAGADPNYRHEGCLYAHRQALGRESLADG